MWSIELMKEKIELPKTQDQLFTELVNNEDKMNWLKNQDHDDLNYFFMRAAEQGHIDLVKLLATIPAVEPTRSSNYALCIASARGNIDLVKFLVTLPGVTPDADNNYPLRIAVRQGHIDVVKFFILDCKVDPSVEDNYALVTAAEKGHIELVKFLSARPEVDPSARDNLALYFAAKNGYINVVQFLAACPEVTHLGYYNGAERAAREAGYIAIAEFIATLPVHNPQSQNDVQSISMMVLGGFIAAVGIAAIAVAFAVLNAATCGIAGVVTVSIGAAATLSGVGLFGTGAYKKSQVFDEQNDEQMSNAI